MKRNKGFTLVELLAVIVILAVIALIATPTVLSMIEEAREGAAKSSMQAYVKGMETAVMTSLMKNDEVDYDDTYTIVGDKATGAENKQTLELEMKNDQPSKEAKTNTMTVSGGNVTEANLTFGTYAVTYKFAGGASKICVEKANKEGTYPACGS